jgi:hypothetical protein
MRNTLLIITALVMLFAACSKDEPRGEKIILSEMSQIETDIIDFLEKLDDQHDGSLPVADAVFYLDAGFNYRYSHIGNDQEFTITRIDTSYVNLEVFEGYSTYTEMKATFDDIFDEMSVLFEAIDDDKKALIIIHLTQVSENTLQVISVWKYSMHSFTGDWFWGWKHGKCDGTKFGHDATDAILYYYNMNAYTLGHGIWINKSFSNIYLAEDQIMEISGNPNQFGYEDRLLFKHVQPTYYVSHCITQTENYYYASKLPSAIAAIVNYEGITKELMNVFFVYRQALIQVGPDLYSIQHGIQTMHGDWNSIIHPPKSAFWAHQ